MGMFKKPKAPEPTASQVELERQQRSELDDLTRDENRRLKAIKRGRQGRRTLLGSGKKKADETGPNTGGTRGGFGGRLGAGGPGSAGSGGGARSSGGARGSGGGIFRGAGKAGAGVRK